MLYNTTVTVNKPTASTRNALGRGEITYSIVTTVPAFRSPLPMAERADGVDGSLQRWRLYCPYFAGMGVNCQVVMDGDTYEVTAFDEAAQANHMEIDVSKRRQ